MKFKALPFPIVYLDLNHFIELAKDVKSGNLALYDRTLGLRLTKRAVFAGSSSLMQEILEIKSPVQRMNIWKVVVTLTDGFVLRDIQSILELEFANSIVKHFDLDGRIQTMPLLAFAVGSPQAFGNAKVKILDPYGMDEADVAATEENLNLILNSDEMASKLINEKTLPKLQEDGPQHEAMKAQVEAERAA